uniref:(+)-piperitol/(+)-sesamin synthase n=1 Tax=Scoparia dulcis TaxID=107240 RepID=A0A1W7HBX7_SCODU
MEPITWLYAFLSFSFLVLVAFKFNSSAGNKKLKLPPSPKPALPFLGHIHLIKQPLHRAHHALAQKLGPIFSLRVGNRLMVVISSPALVEEAFTKENDVTLAGRPKLAFGTYVLYENTGLGAAPYGDHWRHLRRLTATEVFSSIRLNTFSFTRHDEMKNLLQKLNKIHAQRQKDDDGFARVEIRPLLTELAFNVVMRMVSGKRFYGEQEGFEHDEKKGKKFRELIVEMFKLADASNPADFFPIFRLVDFTGYTKDLTRVGSEMDALLQSLIDEQKHDKSKSTMIQHLLSLQESEPEYYTDVIIKGIIMVMLFGGTDTTAMTIEWAMSALVNDPEKLVKAQAEIDALVGSDRLINESDMSQLPYLRNVISETLRLFPAAPLLIPHEATQNCKIGGYDIPKDTMCLVNAWAIHRDPTVWDEPTIFKPERFEAGEVGPPKLMPFGMGKRSCPGITLAQRVVGLGLGALLQCFEWKRIGEELVDLTEGNGLSLPKAIPLEAKFKPRDVLSNALLEN